MKSKYAPYGESFQKSSLGDITVAKLFDGDSVGGGIVGESEEVSFSREFGSSGGRIDLLPAGVRLLLVKQPRWLLFLACMFVNEAILIVLLRCSYGLHVVARWVTCDTNSNEIAMESYGQYGYIYLKCRGKSSFSNRSPQVKTQLVVCVC